MEGNEREEWRKEEEKKRDRERQTDRQTDRLWGVSSLLHFG